MLTSCIVWVAPGQWFGCGSVQGLTRSACFPFTAPIGGPRTKVSSWRHGTPAHATPSPVVVPCLRTSTITGSANRCGVPDRRTGRRGTVAGTCLGRELGRRTKINRIIKRKRSKKDDLNPHSHGEQTYRDFIERRRPAAARCSGRGCGRRWRRLDAVAVGGAASQHRSVFRRRRWEQCFD